MESRRGLRLLTEFTSDDYGREREHTMVFWMICKRKGKMWLAERVKFVCENYLELYDQIYTALLQVAPPNHHTRAPTPYGTSREDVVEYRGLSYKFAVLHKRVSVREEVRALGTLRSVVLYNQNESVDTRSEIEVGDFCSFGEVTPRAPKTPPSAKK